jgi:hypothetical protein
MGNEQRINSSTAAIIVHMINNRVCELNGEEQISWDDAPQYMRDGLIEALEGDLMPEAGHQAWMENRLANGWTLGPVKSIENKTSPCLVPYSQLPYEQRVKDAIRCGVRDFLREFGTPGNWETGVVECSDCGGKGVTVVPYGKPEPFECEHCGKMAMVFREMTPSKLKVVK